MQTSTTHTNAPAINLPLEYVAQEESSTESPDQIDLGMNEQDMAQEINKQLQPHRMEIVSTEVALFGDIVNFGHWIVRGFREPSKGNPNPCSYLIKRHTTPMKIAELLNAGALPR